MDSDQNDYISTQSHELFQQMGKKELVEHPRPKNWTTNREQLVTAVLLARQISSTRKTIESDRRFMMSAYIYMCVCVCVN